MAVGKSARIRIEVAYAFAQRQGIITLELCAGKTVLDAVECSGIRKLYPWLDLSELKVGIFGRPVTPVTVLADGDRVEIYRPLIADPKEARRHRAVRRG
jgi:putative ubiquitin-RnfH superfamily antitoxin RatB of RatAB toxin-antitoxin module